MRKIAVHICPALIFIYFSCPVLLQAQRLEFGIQGFGNQYGRTKADGRFSSQAHVRPGAGFSFQYLTRVDSQHNISQCFEISVLGYRGKIESYNGSHFGTSSTNLEFSKMLISAGFYPLGFRFFKGKTLLSAGVSWGVFILRRTSGYETEIHVKDTFVPGYGQIYYPYPVTTRFDHSRTRFDNSHLFQVNVRLTQQIFETTVASFKMGAFCRFAVSPEYTGYSEARPFQYGLAACYAVSPRLFSRERSGVHNSQVSKFSR